jgi:diadenosine tetraphosphatase ApaH/serine/threonine PP2A family protein phosphatase
LEAVLAALERERPDAVWCLGDVVGYGPQPSSCCTLTEEHADIGLVGNHDLGVIGRLDLDEFSPEAAEAARWTAEVLTPEASRYLEGLEASALTDGAALYHGSPREPVWEYVLGPDSALAALELAPRPLVLVGHSHVALAVSLGDTLDGGLAPEGTQLDLASAERWLLNPGSVGQPRDGDPRAAWLLLDLDGGRAEFRRCVYPVEKTQQEILDAGLPETLATRLESGL